MTLVTYCWRRCLQGQFLYAAKAFDVLERLDGAPEHWEGKQGACVGVLQMVAAGKETGETLRSVDGVPVHASHGLEPKLLLVFIVKNIVRRAWTECLRLQWHLTRHALRLRLQQHKACC